MFLAQGGQPVDVRVQLRLGARSVIARRPRARQRLIGIPEHALGLCCCARPAARRARRNALEQPVAIAGRQFAGQARQRFRRWLLGVARRRAERDWPSPCWIHSSPGMPACSGLLCPRPGKSKPNSAASAFSAASPSRRSAPPSISSSQRAVRNCFSARSHAPRGTPAPRWDARRIRRAAPDRRPSWCCSVRGGADGRRHGALAGLVGADEQVQPGCRPSSAKGWRNLRNSSRTMRDSFIARLLRPLPRRCIRSSRRSASEATAACASSPGAACIACNCAATPRPRSRWRQLREIGLVRLQQQNPRNHRAARAPARPPRPPPVAAAPSRAGRHGRPAPASARPRRAARTVGPGRRSAGSASRARPTSGSGPGPTRSTSGTAPGPAMRPAHSPAHCPGSDPARACPPAALVHPQAAVPVAQRQIVQPRARSRSATIGLVASMWSPAGGP